VAAAPGATTFGQRVPRVSGPDDPLVDVVQTLINVADSRSRRDRAKLLMDRLEDADGVSAVPLLTSLRLRADWAAADQRAIAPIAKLAQSTSAAVRAAALETLREILASRIVPKDREQLDAMAEALRETLDSSEVKTRERVAAIASLEHLLALESDIAWARKMLISQLTGAATYAERSAAAAALSQLAHPQSAKAVADALAALPLDETPARESLLARAAMRLDAKEAKRVLLARLKRSIAARESIQAEVEPLGRLRSEESLPMLLAASAQRELPMVDRQAIARALGRLGDDRAVPVLVNWLRAEDYQLKPFAMQALENLDSEAAAREVRLLLKTEPQLAYKLRIARLLARHGFADGYALATEHLADVGHLPTAALVLAALDDPRTVKELSSVIAAQPDRRWHAAALAGLAAVGDQTAGKQLLEILSSDRHPLAADAAEAVGLAADAELLAPLASLVRSRNKQIALASLVAVRRFLSGVRTARRGIAAAEASLDFSAGEEGRSKLSPEAIEISAKSRAAISEAVASLATDAYVDSDVRQEAFAVARLLGGDAYGGLLAELADQAELEGTALLAAVQAEIRRERAGKD
jgi:hypothetical protein